MSAVADQDRGELGSFVKSLRERAGMTQRAVEKATDGRLKATHVAGVELGHTGMSAERIDLFCSAVGAEEDEYRHLLSLAGIDDSETPTIERRLHQVEEVVATFDGRLSEIEDLLRQLVERVAPLSTPRSDAPHEQGSR